VSTASRSLARLSCGPVANVRLDPPRVVHDQIVRVVGLAERCSCVPCGFDSHGMPIGLQIVGKPGDERIVLNLAHQYALAAKADLKRPIP